MTRPGTHPILIGLMLLAASSPVYLLAVWSGLDLYLSDATAEEKGWLIILFPMFFVPPFVPWLVSAIPIATALACPGGPPKVAGTGVALVLALWVSERIPDWKYTYLSSASPIGSLSATTFVGGIWLTTLIMFAFLRHVRRCENTIDGDGASPRE